jgi:hypothetical protein
MMCSMHVCCVSFRFVCRTCQPAAVYIQHWLCYAGAGCLCRVQRHSVHLARILCVLSCALPGGLYLRWHGWRAFPLFGLQDCHAVTRAVQGTCVLCCRCSKQLTQHTPPLGGSAARGC